MPMMTKTLRRTSSVSNEVNSSNKTQGRRRHRIAQRSDTVAII